MRLETLIQDMPITLRQDTGEVDLLGLTDDSRAVTPGMLFIARPAPGNASGSTPGISADADALRFIPRAIQAGAAAVLLPHMQDAALDALPNNLAVMVATPGVAVDQRLAGQLAERFYDHPSAKLKLLGVTGTNGKTTTVTLTKHLLESAGHKTGLIGTVELDTGAPSGPTPATLTTPGAIQLSQLLAEMVTNACTHCVMEVSSHALDQGRADHVRFAAAAFTNLTQDHLDYHGTMEAYADAKAILFGSLQPDAFAILNADDPASKRMARHCRATLAWITNNDPNTITVTPRHLTAGNSRADFTGPWGTFTATLPTPGMFNLTNALQAAALAHAVADLTADQLHQALETARPVPGRLEPVGIDWPKPPTPNSQLPTVLVDYAHTPDALQNVGNALRQLTTGKLITVFGCGGDRDRAKRPLMAQAAQQYADVVVLTSDNPRTENPTQILSDAAAGFDPNTQHPTPTTHTLPDRAEAIRFAIHFANENDTVLIAGKGHEDYQILGTTKHPFDDREQAAAALREKCG